MLTTWSVCLGTIKFLSKSIWHHTTFHCTKSGRVRSGVGNTILPKLCVLPQDDGAGHLLKAWMLNLKEVCYLLTACPFPAEPEELVPHCTIWNWILAVADPPRCLLMPPCANLNIKKQQFFPDHFANTYKSPSHTPCMRYFPSIVIWGTYKPTNTPSNFLAVSLLQCHPKRVISVDLVWAGSPQSLTLLFLDLQWNQSDGDRSWPPPLCSAEAVATWLSQGLMWLLQAFPDSRCITRCATRASLHAIADWVGGIYLWSVNC